MKALALTAGILLVIGCLCGIAAFLFPVVLTGKYCDITIDEIQFTSDRDAVRIAYRTRTTVETKVATLCPGRSMTSTTPWRVPAWPLEHADEMSFRLLSAGEKEPDPETQGKRILIEASKTYRLRRGEKLVFFRRPGPGGTEGYFEVRP